MDYSKLECFMVGVIMMIYIFDFYLTHKKHIVKFLQTIRLIKKPQRRTRRGKTPLKIVVGGSNE